VKDVQFNLASLRRFSHDIFDNLFLSQLENFSFNEIKVLINGSDRNDDELILKTFDWTDTQLQFKLGKFSVKGIELKGPEFVGLIEGETYNSGFEASKIYNVKLDIKI
jgi:hypothetical protein